MGEDIRRRVVTSFRNAIDFEQNNNDVEAYRKYLDGVALVAAALQQDAEYTWVAGNSSLSDKERRSLLGFAKQSVDRLIFLLDKQDPSNIFRGTTNASVESKDNLVSSPPAVTQSTSRSERSISRGNYSPALQNTLEQDEDISPIARMRKENNLLMTRYAARLQTASTKSQRHNLQLELQRRLMENNAIAQQQQEVWEQQRSKVTEWCLQVADEKFKIKEKIENGSITEADFKKQRLFAGALQYEEEHLWLKRLKQDLLSSPKDEIQQRDIVAHVLNDKLHPLGSLMGQMQHAILNKIHPLIKVLPESTNSAAPQMNINKRNPRIVSPSEDESSADRKQPESASLANSCITEEDMKQDVKLLETLLCALYEPLTTDPGANILTELLHELYFPPIKPALINLIRLGIADVEEELVYRMSLDKENQELLEMDEELVRSCCHALHRLTLLGSPCQMLDSLAAILKTLAVSEDSQAKSIGADDLLPRLMTVVMSSGMPNLLAEAVYMENFMPVNRALGEAGYCLTVLQSKGGGDGDGDHHDDDDDDDDEEKKICS
ncbi:Uncharacterized protein GBIM_08199 [Gryllus bimaculatus]|nr:Uncharacterized protein GBIM_08199 [Gryllus bimaculatus]